LNQVNTVQSAKKANYYAAVFWAASCVLPVCLSVCPSTCHRKQ